MGRIAEALQKAETQRSASRNGCADPPAQVPPTAAVVQSMAPEREAQPPATSAPASPNRSDQPTRVEGMSDSLVSYYEPSSVISEQYRSLRTRLLSQNPENEHRILAITSSVPRDGKSVTALNAAFSLSEIRHLQTLVVDGDFRRGSLATMLNLPDSPGLADVLQGRATYEEALQATPLPNLFFMAAGHTKGRSAAEVLSDASAGAVFERYRKEFNYTIVDTPPATTVADVGVIGQWCHGVIMVVRLNKTPEPVAQRAVRVLQVNNVPILGALLVGDEARAPGYGYYRYYNYYRYYYSGAARGRDRDD